MIDEMLKKYEIEEDRFYDLGKLHEVLFGLGLTALKRSSFTTAWWDRRRKKGTIIFPDKSSRVEEWRMTGKQLKDIVKAFVPGGRGHYDYRENL